MVKRDVCDWNRAGLQLLKQPTFQDFRKAGIPAVCKSESGDHQHALLQGLSQIDGGAALARKWYDVMGGTGNQG